MGVTFELCQEVLKFYAKSEDLDTLYVTMCVLNGLFCFTAIAGNLVIIFALQKASSIPATSRILMQSLALTDLSVGLLGHPLYIAVIVGIRQNYGCENIHQILMAFFILSVTLVIVSFLVVFLIGLDRFLAISLHLRYNELVTTKRVVTMVVAVWVLALSSVFIGVFYALRVGEFALIVCGFVFMLLLSIIYMKVYLVARRHQASINSQAQAASSLNLARNKNLAIKTLYVFAVFEVCYLPYLIALALLLTSGPSVTLQGAVQLSTVLVMVNSSLNPIIFGWKMTEIRQLVKNKFRTLFC